MKLTFKTNFITLSFLSIVTLLIDYFFTKELMIEDGVIDLIVILFALYILQLSVSKLFNKYVNLVFNFGVSFLHIYLAGKSVGTLDVTKYQTIEPACGVSVEGRIETVKTSLGKNSYDLQYLLINLSST